MFIWGSGRRIGSKLRVCLLYAVGYLGKNVEGFFTLRNYGGFFF